MFLAMYNLYLQGVLLQKCILKPPQDLIDSLTDDEIQDVWYENDSKCKSYVLRGSNRRLCD
jgi:hypothetical protein